MHRPWGSGEQTGTGAHPNRMQMWALGTGRQDRHASETGAGPPLTGNPVTLIGKSPPFCGAT